MLSATASNPIQKPLRLRRVNHSDEIVSGFAKLLKNESMTDVTLICNGGRTIRAHRVILSTFSPYFKAIFESQPFTNNPCQYPVIVIKDLAYHELRTIVEFIYKGEVSVQRDKLSSILEAARALEVSGLSDLKYESFLNSSSSSSSTSSSNVSFNNIVNTCVDTDSSSINGTHNIGTLGSLGTSLSVGVNPNPNTKSWKRGLDTTNFLDTANLDAALKKSRISLDSSIGAENVTPNVQALNFLSENGISSNDGVRSLLQQPSRLAQGLRTSSSNLQQQQQLQKAQRHLTIEQLLQHRQLQQRQLLQQKLRQQQQQIKQQILQQHLLQRSSQKSSQARNGNHGNNNFLQFQEKIKAQILEKQKQQSLSSIQDGLNSKQNSKLSGNSRHQNDSDSDNRKSEDRTEDDKATETEIAEDDGNGLEVDVEGDQKAVKGENGDDESIRDKDGGQDGDDNSESVKDSSKINGSKVNKNNNNSNGNNNVNEQKLEGDESNCNEEGKVDDEESDSKLSNEKMDDDDDKKSISIYKANEDGIEQDDFLDEEDLNDEDEEFEVEIDKDLIFQRQQHLRLQQLQKQQQIQLQIQQGQQEQKLLELHRQLQQANSSSMISDLDDSSTGMSLDWQEGFVDDAFTNFSFNENLLNNADRSLSIFNQSSNSNGNHNSSINKTPDFLQPRGPGRPRKGNKTQDISPCPECNKVFVRPDVLKLHYRSVHLNERHPCNMCPKIFKWPGDLSKHKKTKHPEAMANNNNHNNSNNNNNNSNNSSNNNNNISSNSNVNNNNNSSNNNNNSESISNS